MTTTTPTTPPATAPTKTLTKQDKDRLTLRKLFDQQKPELAKLLPRGMDPERLMRMALTECVRNPKLLECTAESWALAMQQCAAQGLFPDSALGFMYLIPSNNRRQVNGQWQKVMEVRAQRGYQGDMKLARNTGEVERIGAEVVYTKDTYKVTKGLDPNIEHVPYDGDDEPGELRACYAVAKLRSGEVSFVTLTRRDVMRHKASSQSADNDDSPWKKHEAAMWKKTAIHELFKWLPKDTEAMERAASVIAGDRHSIETTAVDLGRVELPSAGETAGGALDRLAGDLEGAGGGEARPAQPPKDCKHPQVPVGLAPGETVVCPDCGQEFSEPPTEPREPGSDDGPPAAVVEDIKKLAGKAGDTSKGRQGRLQD